MYYTYPYQHIQCQHIVWQKKSLRENQTCGQVEKWSGDRLPITKQ